MRRYLSTLASALAVLQLVEQVHDTENPLFVKRSNFYEATRGSGEPGSVYVSRIKVLADLAKLSKMDQRQHVRFKVIRDLPIKVQEKVLRQHDMMLDEMTILVAESEAIDVINASLKPEHAKVPPTKKRQRRRPWRRVRSP